MNITTSNAEFISYPSNEWIVEFDSGYNKDPESNLQSIAQDIRFALETERYRWPIMGANFGTSFQDLIGTDYNYIRSEIVRRINDALSIDDRILTIGEFEFQKLQDSGMLVKCTITTIMGDVTISTTIQG
jgi:hypothetical protein